VTVTASRLLDVDSGRILRDQVLTIENERVVSLECAPNRVRP
jgi:hypothetical protein